MNRAAERQLIEALDQEVTDLWSGFHPKVEAYYRPRWNERNRRDREFVNELRAEMTRHPRHLPGDWMPFARAPAEIEEEERIE